jgi:dinuclear metal center YbgI/SA1388 family protein
VEDFPKMTTVADIVAIMNDMAPPELAESWDSIGLQIGDPRYEVRKLWVALDPLPDVVSGACNNQVDLLITHHPLIFKPLSSIDFSSSLGTILQQAATNRLSIFCAHTNLDKAIGGTNDVLARAIGLESISVLTDAERKAIWKLVVFVPASHEQALLQAILETDAGAIGNYRACSFRTAGKGTFEPMDSAHPFIGSRGQINEVDEVRIEILVEPRQLASTLAVIRSHHPYETMAYDVYPLIDRASGAGMGRIGTLSAVMRLEALAQHLCRCLHLGSLTVAGDPDLPVRRVALCTGSGSSLVRRFFQSDADVFISGDLHYHDARDAEQRGKGLIDIGHFDSEHIVVGDLSRRLGSVLASSGVVVEACTLETNPFRWMAGG